MSNFPYRNQFFGAGSQKIQNGKHQSFAFMSNFAWFLNFSQTVLQRAVSFITTKYKNVVNSESLSFAFFFMFLKNVLRHPVWNTIWICIFSYLLFVWTLEAKQFQVYFFCLYICFFFYFYQKLITLSYSLDGHFTFEKPCTIFHYLCQENPIPNPSR